MDVDICNIRANPLCSLRVVEIYDRETTILPCCEGDEVGDLMLAVAYHLGLFKRHQGFSQSSRWKQEMAGKTQRKKS